MTVVTRSFRRAVPAALALAAAIGTGFASGADAREMRVSSWEPEQGFYSSKVIQAWIDQINPKLSEGVSFKLYPGAILGSPPAQQELVRKGVADVALIGPTYTPGVFPRTTVVEVPGIAPSSAAGTDVLQTLLDEGLLGDEYKDFKVIGLFSTSGYNPFMHDRPVRMPEDIKGMKLRTPSQFMATLLAMFGASGVSMPAPQVYESLERNVVDGAMWTFDAYTTFRLYETAPNITMLKLSANPLAIVMNKQVYEGLPEPDRAAIDSLSGRAFADWVAPIIDGYDQEQSAAMSKKEGVTFVVPDEAESAAWKKAYEGAPQAWLDSRKELGIDAAAVLDRAREISAKH